jgi:hypothetical protein
VSDNESADTGRAATREIVAGVAAAGGAEALMEFAVELAFQIAELVEREAYEKGVGAVDLADIMFLD